MAGLGRRVGALFVDWFIAVILANLFFTGGSSLAEGAPVLITADPLVITLLFFGITALSIALFGGTLGHLLFRMQITTLDGEQPGWWRPFLRQALLMLVLPAVVWDTDHRGGHDIISRLALRRRN